jgi:hypothetical protein
MDNRQLAKKILLIANCLLSLSLSLLEAGVLFVNHIKLTLTTHNLAISASFFYGCSNSHSILFEL